MAEAVIRAMTARDVPVAARLVAQLTGQPFTVEDMSNRLEWVAASPIDWLFVGEVDGQVHGVLGFRLRERLEHVSRWGEIYLIVTDTRLRRRGIGRSMMQFAEQFARAQGCIGTWLVSGFGRKDEAHQFYHRLGYDVTGSRFVKVFE
jgi:GNAT superfamily N-acetyltransferase